MALLFRVTLVTVSVLLPVPPVSKSKAPPNPSCVAQQSPRLRPFWMVKLEMLTVALVNESMSWLKDITLSTLSLRFANVPPWTMVVAWPAPVMLTESWISRVPVAEVWWSAAFLAMVRVYVPAGNMMLSVPASAFALITASRKLQSFATPLQALVIGDTGVGSSNLFTVNVGSGIGISIEGAISP